jgi:hypothetical protein
VPEQLIEYRFGNRNSRVEFMPATKGVTVRVTFDAEQQHAVDYQRAGWQAILDNFGKCVEGNRLVA